MPQYNPSAYASANVGRRGPGQPAPGNQSTFNQSLLQYQQLYPWLGTGLASANRLNVPSQPGITSESLDEVPPNADDTVRKVEETQSGTVVSTKTSNLVSCPNAEGEVGLGCWLFSSDNDRFARKNLETDTMPGEKEPKDIMVVPGNWMDLQNDPASQSYTNVTADLYNQELLASEQRIFTGVMVNSNTGQMYETYEDDVPPPNTDRKRRLPEEFSIQNPILTALNGGWDPSLPTRNKTEVMEVMYGADAGLNPWGSGLYASAIRDITEQKDVRQQFNNRNGFVPIEPAWDTRAVGFVGHVSAYRGTPHMPPTQREGKEFPVTFNDTVTNVQNSDFDRPSDRTNYTNPKNGNREHLGMFQNGTMCEANLVPGRINYSAMELHQTAGKTPPNLAFDTTQTAGQIYLEGDVQLKEEGQYSKYVAAADSHAIKLVPMTRGITRGARKQDQNENNKWLTTANTGSDGVVLNRDFLANVRLMQEPEPTADRLHIQSVIGQGDSMAEARPGVRLVTDRSFASNNAATNRVSSATTIGAGDGRMADESKFLNSVRLVTDARQAMIRVADTLDAGPESRAYTKLAVERRPATRSQGADIDGGTIKIMPEYIGPMVDRSRSTGVGLVGSLETESTADMRAVNRDSRFSDLDRENGRMTFGDVSGLSFEHIDKQNSVYKNHFGEALPRLQPSFIPVW